MTNSLDAIKFRRALQDHTTCANFIQYLGIKEEPEQFLVNNVLFWLEVQRFKVTIYIPPHMCYLYQKFAVYGNAIRVCTNYAYIDEFHELFTNS